MTFPLVGRVLVTHDHPARLTRQTLRSWVESAQPQLTRPGQRLIRCLMTPAGKVASGWQWESGRNYLLDFRRQIWHTIP
ncbi:hypothetical protein [Thermogemmatispora sp.]|uniref:hypothetical protein n=1 Tax=Thermogemmatispora sp. TaxID=1968838 RepID=UPI002ACC1F63|nr:hypothetical protein [Thermogemmatispora sp.]